MTRVLGALAATLVLSAVSAHAQTSVIVLGIRSVEGDEEVARNLTGAMRNAASRIEGWVTSQADVSLSQMSMVHGCDEPDAACMAAIAQELGQARVIYGTVRRTSAGDTYDFAVTLYVYDATSRQISDSLTDTIPRSQVDIDPLRPRAQRYINRFSSASRLGDLRVRANVPGATVRVDGREVGTTGEDGVLLVEGLPEGTRNIEISAPDHGTFQASVEVPGDDRAELGATLTARQPTNLRWIPGAGAIAVGLVMVIIGAQGGLQALDQKNSRTAARAVWAGDTGATAPMSGSFGDLLLRQAMDGDAGNVCEWGRDDARPMETRELAVDLCSQRRRARILQYVGFGLGAVLVGGGLLWILNSLRSPEAPQTARLQNLRLTPEAGLNYGGMQFGFDF